mmetsp:Transcript_61338/g.72854  ORF Transcript_61338/g.72854 Transcript_61338/m.72854 type:complete len:286 (-) Transcript_61338:398-1255(-)|eukprot:CAMPEP_0172500062 /NCGR_PEP_ID=MMETSP1066-20121228/134096_1 /TAXON_ID=671091 /ORGANISM="Coscinodiscus wailesii, Strain CCMP2513" /LENGTH=285 /DNA_ID=CAMNT_0013274125 /DNA_START=74 /DNA_END=931 /DNA_ORIENTATION=+
MGEIEMKQMDPPLEKPPNDGADDAEFDPDADEEQKQRDILLHGKFFPFGPRKPTMREYAAIVVGITCLSLNIVGSVTTFSFPGQIVIIVMTAVSGITVPLMVYGQTEMSKVDAFRDILNDIRKEVGVLAGENDKFKESVDQLEGDVSRLQEVESGLKALTDQQGGSVNSLIELTKENKKIMNALKNVMKKRAFQKLLSLLFQCDSSGDCKLDGEEIDKLILGMTIMDNIHFDENEFRRCVEEKGGTIDGVLEVIRGLLDEEDGGTQPSVIQVKETDSMRGTKSSG